MTQRAAVAGRPGALAGQGPVGARLCCALAAAYDVRVEHGGPNPVAWRPIKGAGASASSMASGAAVTLDGGAEASRRCARASGVRRLSSNYCRDGPGFLLKSRDGHWLLADEFPALSTQGKGAELRPAFALNGTAPVGVTGTSTGRY